MGARRRLLASLLLCTAPLAADASTCSVDDERQECRERHDLPECVDNHDECKSWAKAGECDANPSYMLQDCQRSCNFCEHELDSNDFGKTQIIPPRLAAPTKEVIANSVAYMKEIVSDPEYSSVKDECTNNDRSCSQWALGTGCDDNPKYMKMECAPACQSCDYILDLKKRCAPDPEGKDAIDAGGMDALFERMVRLADESDWSPSVLSRPAISDEASAKSCEEDVMNPCGVHEGPWVITLEDFVTPLEVETLLNWGAKKGYERSQAGDEVVEARTSSHAWCNDDCYEDPIVQALSDRIAHVTGIPTANFECLQLLKYIPGTYYKPHNDFIEKHAEQAHGSRLLTFFVYFNEVEEGGGTRFPRLNPPEGLQVQPKPGRVLIWPSVNDADLLQEDKRTEHEAVPVVRGEKYAANAWIHTRDFQTPFRAGCPS